jgi:uracil-DNA glycosylase family 4
VGFFDIQEKQAPQRDKLLKGLSVELLHKKQCAVCPLNLQRGLIHPQMEPTGTKRPLVYMLGEAPGKSEDRKGRQFAGQSGEVLHVRIPPKWQDDLRWNNVVRTRPPDNRDPTHVEIECCRPSIVADIERTKPVAIFGFGAIPLQWAIDQSGITKWAGRCTPIKVGKHACWYFPMFHPSYILRTRRFTPRDPKAYGSDLEFKFALDLKRAFRMVEKGLPEPIVDTREDALANVEWVTGHGKGDLQRVLEEIDACYHERAIGLDYETDRLRPYGKGAIILTASIARPGLAFAFAYQHKDAGWTPAQRDTIRVAWRRMLLKAKCRKISHHLGFELEWSAVFFGTDTLLAPGWDDSMAQAFIIDAAVYGFVGSKKKKGQENAQQERPQATQGLDFLCQQHFGLPVKDLFRMNRKAMADEKVETVCEYNGVDSKYHRKLFYRQRSELRRLGLWSVYCRHIDRIRAAVATQLKGVPVDPEQVQEFYDEHDKRLKALERKIAKLPIAAKFRNRFGRNLRPSANKDISDALTKIARLRLEKTDETTLTATKHPLALLTIKWRKVAKLLSTYIIPVLPPDRLAKIKARAKADGREIKGESVLFPDGSMHPIVSTTKTRTWRTASEDPNAQNWPHRGPAKYIRKQVAVSAERRIVAIDYAGIQARNVAMESLDPGLMKQYWSRYDIHGAWLKKLWRIVPDWRPLSDIGKDLTKKELFKECRSVMKNKFVFPSFFGAIGETVAGPTYLGIEERHGKKLSDMFFAEFPKVRTWHEELRETYNRDGYVTGKSGFIRAAPIEMNQLINAPIQADESIIVCGAWHRLLMTGDTRKVPMLMVHDDLTFNWAKSDMDKLLEEVIPMVLYQKHEWERVVPMEIEVKVGTNWCDMKEIGKFATTKSGGWKQVEGDVFSDRWDYKVGQDGVPTSRQHGWPV